MREKVDFQKLLFFLQLSLKYKIRKPIIVKILLLKGVFKKIKGKKKDKL